jgi:predicted PurR-regulated permease PerM
MQQSVKPHDAEVSRVSDWTVFRRSFIIIGTISLTLALWHLANVVLLAFGAVLFAIVLRAAARPISHGTGMSDGLAVGLTALLILCLFLGLAALFGATLSLFGSLDSHSGFAQCA